MSLALIVPVKDLAQAKSRLAPLLSAQERGALAAVMLEHTLTTLGSVSGFTRRAVVTNHAPAIDLAIKLGFEVLHEGVQRSESQSVDAACATLASEGISAMLRVPLDLPLIEGKDVTTIVNQAIAGERVILVPSLSGTGTNALYRSPPNLFPSKFGPGSLALHREQAKARGISECVLALESMALDIDDPEDLRELARRARPCPALDYLRASGILERLNASENNSQTPAMSKRS